MENKITLLGLCRAYSKIEIPILQRNYAQGHSKRVREPFVKHLVDTLEEGHTLELDFIYGSERKGEQGDASKVLIPLDGQQRLTTLWLLYWYLAVKDNRLDEELRRELSRFVYETRPMALDFYRYMLRITEGFNEAEAERTELLSKPEAYITNCYWYDLAWAQDATVSGMLKMLTEFARHYKTLQAIPFERLEQCIGFYHLPLSDFGLTNDLYIRMNARGAQLTDFEHFKSEFYKLISNHPRLEEIKTKMETTWVENLWAYKPEGVDVVDEPFMGLLRFVTYVNDIIKQRREGKTFERTQEPTSIAYLSSIYSDNDSDSVERLIDMLEVLPLLNEIDLSKSRFSRDESLEKFIEEIFKGKDIGIKGNTLVYATMQYLRIKQTVEGIERYLQVVRNLSANTSYASRELGQAFSAIDVLAEQGDVYEYLAGGGEVPYFTTQLKEERWKARYIKRYPVAEDLIHKIEDNPYLLGCIATLLAVAGGKESLDQLSPEELQSERLATLYRGYEECSRDGFKTIWGDLLNSELYSHRTWDDRVVYDKDYATNYDLVRFAMGYAESGLSLGDYCQEVERQEVLRLFDVYERYPERSRNPQEQLYLYYVITRRLMRQGISRFFAGGYNFGFLVQENSYCSLFTRGIEGSHWFEKHNPIYQTYTAQFRYNEGLKKHYALLPELADECPTDVWAKLLDWAKS